MNELEEEWPITEENEAANEAANEELDYWHRYHEEHWQEWIDSPFED